jgi:hypothetical protein
MRFLFHRRDPRRIGGIGVRLAAELHQFGLQTVYPGLQFPHLGTKALKFHGFKMFPDLMGRQHLWIPSLEPDIPSLGPHPEEGDLRVADHNCSRNPVNTKPAAPAQLGLVQLLFAVSRLEKRQ